MDTRFDQRRVVITGLMLLALAVIGWRVLSLGMAERFARSDPARALSWNDGHPVALVLQAERLAEAGDDAGARGLALKALQSNPLDGRGFRVLARLADKAGDVEATARFYAMAVKRSPRDLPSHAWLFEHHLRAGRVAVALLHGDQMLRVQPELAKRLFPMLAELSVDPAAAPALARRLVAVPPWREKFLLMLFRNATDGRRLLGLVAAITGGDSGLGQAELAAWLERLIADQAWDEAYAIWASQRPLGVMPLANVYNGGFETEASGLGFDWRFEHVAGASIELLAGDGVSGRQALSVGFDHQRVPFRHARQLMVLTPGHYLFEGHQRAEDLMTPRGLAWEVTCAGSSLPLASSAPLKGNSGWTEFAFEFDVPEQGCAAQWLELVLAARVEAEQMVEGRAWFDDLRIVRL